MQIWAHTLVKNESRWLWYSVASVVNHVDKVLLWDTGSTDGTLEVINNLSRAFPNKILVENKTINTPSDFTQVRQQMLDKTKADWFLMIDGDEIWWDEHITKLVDFIQKNGSKYESVVVPTINLVGDVFHYQEDAAGMYNLAGKVGHYNLRAINTKISGLHSQGVHGVWGWADESNKMIQERDPEKIKFLDIPYMHATNLRRADLGANDAKVIKRKNKFRYELGIEFPKDYFYPEVFFRKTVGGLVSPWGRIDNKFKIRAGFETPLRQVKRRLIKNKVGY